LSHGRLGQLALPAALAVMGLVQEGRSTGDDSQKTIGSGSAKVVELGNNQLSMRFDVTDGTLISIRNRALGEDYTVGASAPSLFNLRYFDGRTKKVGVLSPEPGSLTGHVLTRGDGGQTLRFDYRVAGRAGGTAQVMCQATLGDASNEVRWTIAVHNQAEGLEIVEVVFPVLGGLRIGPRSEDNFLTWPAWGAGHLIANPQKNGKRSGEYVGGRATMPWVDLFSRPSGTGENGGKAACGLYFASYDPTLLMTGLDSRPSGDGGALTLQMSKFAHVPNGARWSSSEFVTGVHAGDWHAAADSYREWFNNWSPPPDPPRWLKECDGRLEWTLPLGGNGRFAKDIVEKMQLARGYGLNFARFGGQMVASVSAGKHRCNRFPFPDPLMGTEREFAEVIRSVRGQGGHAAFYINGQAWDPRWPQAPPECAGKIPATVPIPDWEGGFKDNALMHYDGTLYPQYKRASGHWPSPPAGSPYDSLFYFMCSAAKGWQDHLHYWTVEKYVRQYGTDAMFLDQIGADSAKYCFNPAHGHAHHGAWAQGFVALAKRIKENARRIQPEFAMETEGYGDAYSAYFDSFFIAPSSTGFWPDSYPELTRYTFPDHIFFDGFWRIQGPPTLRSPAETLNEVFLLGNRFLVYAQPEVLTRHTALVLDLRRRIKHVLYRARFMDDLGVTVSDPRVRVKRFMLNEPDRKVTLLTVYNHDALTEAKVEVEDMGAPGPVREAAVAALGGDVRPVSPDASGTKVSVRVPPEVLSAVLLVHRGAGIVEEARRAEQFAQQTPRNDRK